MRIVSTRLLVAALGLIVPIAAAAQETAILAVEIERGDSPLGRAEADQLLIRPGGDEVELLGLGEAADLLGRWQVAIYVDQRLTGTGSILRFLETLAAQAEELTRLGEVQLVLAGDEPSTVIRSSDPRLLEQVLGQQSLRSDGEHGVRERRLALIRELERPGGPVEGEPRELVAATLAAELALLEERGDALVHWVAEQGRPTRPRLLLLATEGLGAELEAFYGERVDDFAAALESAGGLPEVDRLGTVLASYGWILVPTVVPTPEDEDDDAVSLRTNQSIGFRVRLGQRDDEEPVIEPEELHLDAGRATVLGRLAGVTGGATVSSLEEIPSVLEGMTRRLPLEVRLPTGGEPVPLDVAARDPGVTVRAPAWIGGIPEAVSEVRLRRSLAGDSEPGELALRARVHFDPAQIEEEPAELEVLIDLAEMEAAGEVPLRISVGVHLQSDDLVTHHDVVRVDPSGETTFSWRRPLTLPPTTDAAVVVVEELATGVWGENVAEFVTRTEAAAAAPTVPEVAPAEPEGPALLLEPLPSDTRTGKVRVRTRTRPDVKEVAFLLDGERVATRRRSPFDTRLDLGRIPEQRSIVAIAYDATGRELGRDGLVVNEAATTFWVQISEPNPSNRVGPVDVVTSTRVPPDDVLERIDYYWNEELVGTTRQEPHRERLLIPVDRPVGYIRVVARLASGRTAEDVVVMNTQRFETEITVELVELYVVVTDAGGRPVRGLDRSDFVVREEEEVQDVESFALAGDLPLTLGLAIDSSLSLFKKLPDVQSAAVDFVDSLRGDRDRAFLVEYGSRPRLVQSITSDLERVADGIRSLEPSGNTAVWEGVTLSLEELSESVGRRALVVFYDGDDEDESYSFKRTLDLARKSRIPIYLIVMNDEAARTQGRGFAVRSRIARLDQLARTGGGRVFYVRTDEDLAPIFEEIGDELRSHYLLTYYPQRPVQHPEWRPISVELTRSDLEARTISGYGGG